jgi:alanine racemase
MVLPAVLHVDTGMARLGLAEADVGVLATDPSRLDGLNLRYVMSHLAAAEDQSNPSNTCQLQRFERLRTQLPPAPASLANSSGVFLGAAFHFDLLRPGAALYGVAPVPGRPNPMHPVVRLQGRVLQVSTVPTGTPVGYNGRFVADGSMRVATVSVGYADGFPRTLGNRASAGCDGVRLPVIGAVSMDMVTLDVSALPDNRLHPGALVDVIGGDADSLDAVAAKGGTIAYEILTSLGSRYWRHYAGAEAEPLHPQSR